MSFFAFYEQCHTKNPATIAVNVMGTFINASLQDRVLSGDGMLMQFS